MGVVSPRSELLMGVVSPRSELLMGVVSPVACFYVSSTLLVRRLSRAGPGIDGLETEITTL